MKFSFFTACLAIALASPIVNAATVQKLDCEKTALKAGYYYAKLNGDKVAMKSLVVQRVSPDKINFGGDVVLGQRYFLRNPSGDINYCNVFISAESGNCAVFEISASGN